MRIVKILIIAAVLVGLGKVIGSAVATTPEKTHVSVVPESPIAASCNYVGGETVIRISAIEDIRDLHVVFPDGKDLSILPELRHGWSVAHSVTGKYDTITARYVWRGSTHEGPVPCS